MRVDIRRMQGPSTRLGLSRECSLLEVPLVEDAVDSVVLHSDR